MIDSSPQPTRVLVVEDSLDDQEFLYRQLRKTPLGENVLFVSDPRKALDLLQNEDGPRFRQELVVIFLDIHLPFMSGLDLLRIIRETEGMKDFPVIIMTALPTPETIAACTELKARAFVEKPVTFSHFSKVIADLFHSPMEALV